MLRFGAFELDLSAGQLRKSGVLLKVRPQAFRILVLLASRTGQVVTREEIQKAIWSDGTFVDFEQGLNFCIRQIRTVLGDKADSPRFIETIPRRGYRFLVPVMANGAVPALSVEETSPPQRTADGVSKVWRWGVAAVGVAVLGFVLSYFWSPSTPPVRRPVPLTTYPGVERNPALSPDGNQVAFSWNGEKQDNFDIYIKLIGGSAPLRLTTNPADDVSPAWSPDGRTIAFLRRLSGHRNELLLIPALGGGLERKLAETHNGREDLLSLAWSPDGRWLAVSSRERDELAQGLFLVSAQTGEKRKLTEPPPGFDGDSMSAFAPDGRTLAFSRLRGYSAGEVYLLPLTGDSQRAGEARRLTTDNQLGMSPVWTRDGRHILYRLGTGSTLRRELRIIAVSGSRTSERVPSLADDIVEFSLGRHLVYSKGIGDTNIWRAEIPPPGDPPSVPRLFISSTRNDVHPWYSPDGKKIAFISDRSGPREIWIAEASGSNPVQLTSFGGPLVGFTNWSPDGQRLVFHARPEGQADLFTIPAAGGAPKRLTMDPSDDISPSYSHDGRWIYFSSQRSGQSEIWRMPGDGGAATRITHSGGARMSLESPDGKTLYYGTPEKGIWKIPVQGGEAVQLTEPLSPLHAFAITNEGIYYTAAPHARNQSFIRFLRFSTGKSQPVVAVDRPVDIGLSISPDRRLLLFAQLDQSGSDLMLIEDFVVR